GAGHVSARHAIEQPGREHDKKIRPEAVPLDLPEARHRDSDTLAGNIEHQLIAELELQLLLILARQRHQWLALILRFPPAPGGDAVVVAEFRRPRQIKFPVRAVAAGAAA